MFDKVNKVDIGKLYSSRWRKAVFSDKSSHTFFSSYLGEIKENQLFFVLDSEAGFIGKDKFYHLKILTADGIVGYIKIDPNNLKPEKLDCGMNVP